MQTTLMDRLRAATREAHAAAESRPLERAMAVGGVSRDLYADYLVQRLYVHERLESLMRSLLQEEERFRRCVTDDLFQVENLRCDLRALGRSAVPSELLPPARDLIEAIERVFGDRAVAVLGPWYVFEGSKNGGRMLARAVGVKLDLPPGPGLKYLDPHGAEQRARWQTFRAAVDAESWSSVEADAIVAAAQATFAGVSAIDDALWMLHTPSAKQ